MRWYVVLASDDSAATQVSDRWVLTGSSNALKYIFSDRILLKRSAVLVA